MGYFTLREKLRTRNHFPFRCGHNSVTGKVAANRYRLGQARISALWTDNPDSIVLSVIAIYAISWLLVEWLTFIGLRYDTYEMLLMGHEWQYGYWKHPALPPWIAEAVFIISGHSIRAVAALPIACAAIALWLVWVLCKPILGKAGAAIATALSVGSWYLMTPVTQFNHNIAQLPFWVLTVLMYRRATRLPTGLNWIAFGAVAALLVQTKYTGVLLLGTLFLHMCAYGDSRALLKQAKTWLSALVFTLLMLPLFRFLATQNAHSVVYASIPFGTMSSVLYR